MKKHTPKIFLILTLLLFLVVYLLVPSVNQSVNDAIKILSTMGVDGVIEYIRGYGKYAAAVSFLLMILQSIISPIP